MAAGQEEAFLAAVGLAEDLEDSPVEAGPAAVGPLVEEVLAAAGKK